MANGKQYRSRGFSVVAGATLLSLLACQPAAGPTAPAPLPSSEAPNAGTPPPVSVAPTALPSALASSEAPTATPSLPVERPFDGPTSPLSGRIYDAAGALAPDGTVVHVKSLDELVPFSAEASTTGGAYALPAVPLEVLVSITVKRPGWTSRTQVTLLRPYDERNPQRSVVNFGRDKVSESTPGDAYFISPYPEISAIEPAHEETSQDPSKLSFKLTLSEPLDRDNQRRLAAAFTVIPHNQEALAEGGVLPAALSGDTQLNGLRIEAEPIASRVIPYSYRQNSAYLGGAQTASFVWNEEGTEANFSFEAPMKTSDEREAQYAFLLIQRGADAIVDAENLPLGLNDELKYGNTGEGDILRAVLLDPNLALPERQADEAKHWAATHISYSRFAVRRDQDSPRLLSVLARRDYVEDDGQARDRVELTFSEPMVVYPRIAAPGVLRFDQYAFAVGAGEAALETALPAEGTVQQSLSGTPGSDTVRDALLAGSVRLNFATALNGPFVLRFGVRDPRIVYVDLPAGSLPLNRDVIKVRVGGATGVSSGQLFADPAGNAILPADAVQTGPVL